MIIDNLTELISVNKSQEEAILVSDQTLSYFTLINTWGLGQCVVILGLMVNTLNIIVFVRQGLHDSVNISLLGLSASDFGSLFFHFLDNICWTPAVIRMDLPFYPLQIMYYIVWTHVIFTRVTTGITAWITFERCLCIVAPLKIKSIVTPRRTVIFICVLYVIMTASAAPVFYCTRLVWLFDSTRNKSILGAARMASSSHIQTIAFWINNILPMIFFIFITICSVVLVKELKKHGQWRQEAVLSQTNAVTSLRETKVVKLVTMISVVFIACYTPGTFVYIFILAFPQMTYAGRQKNLLVAIFTLLLQLEGINATANFFIYLTQSSKFKSTFLETFHIGYDERKRGSENNGPENRTG